MFRKLVKNKKAQNTAEYAILISLVVAGIIAMQTYAQRALQARVRDAAHYLQNATNDLGSTLQYEPYYLESAYNVVSDESEGQILDNGVVSEFQDSTRTRGEGGFQQQQYGTEFGLLNGDAL